MSTSPLRVFDRIAVIPRSSTRPEGVCDGPIVGGDRKSDPAGSGVSLSEQTGWPC